MNTSSYLIAPEVAAYVLSHSEPLDEIARELVDETSKMPSALMQVSPDQGQFLTLLVRLAGARSVLEIGTFTGFSALCMARGLPVDGYLLACDVNEEWTAVGKKYWQRARVADRIDLRIGPGAETIAALPPETLFDLAFIDADKPSYPDYFEMVVEHLRPGGLLLADNVLWHGEIESSTTESAAALRRFNDLVVADDRVDGVLLALFDGLTFAIRR